MGEYSRALCRSHLAALWIAALLSGIQPALAEAAATLPADAPAGPEPGLTLKLSGRGVAAHGLPCPASGQILRLRVEGAGALEAAWLERLPTAAFRQTDARVTGPFRNGVILLPLSGVAAAAGPDSRCRLVLRGLPAAEVTLVASDWQAVTPLTRLSGMWYDWTGFRPWRHASINSHSAVVQAWHGLSPNVLLGVLFVSVGIAGYWRWRSRFLLWWMLAGWLALDLPWQWRLLEQVEATRDRFAGVPAADRPGLTDDADLWAFAERVKSLLPAGGATRIFVASSSDYGGMRTAYYLYPLNVYWRRGGPELPASSRLRAGDHIVVVQPSQVRFLPQAGRLLFADQGWSVRLLFAADDIGLFEVR
ncbi:MAG: hypothetical protein RJQ10_15885 [Haliea sp.]|uniref:hypothetical protein n=1 Tax=Haliea sp. TaxID=1932666 RepID=UPI0032EBE153